MPKDDSDAGLLDRINGPADLEELDDDQLQKLAQELREFIIETVGEIGGHFGANLGTCELAVALHSLLDSPRDKILWDVGHQAYPHKVLTGRRDAAALDPQVRRARSFLLARGVRARHHGRGPRVHGGGLRRRDQGGDAQARAARDRIARAPAGQGDRRGRGRRHDRRRQLRGAPQRGRAGDAGRDRPQRQRDVDLPQRGRAVTVLQPPAAQPAWLPGPRGARVGLDEAARRHRQADRAAGPSAQGVAQGLLGAGALFRGARLRVRRGDRRTRREGAQRRAAAGAQCRASGGGPHQDREGQGVRAGRGGRARGDGEMARRQAGIGGQEGAAPQGFGRARGSARRSRAAPQYTEVFGRRSSRRRSAIRA